MSIATTTTHDNTMYHATYYQPTPQGEEALHGWAVQDEAGAWRFYGDGGAMALLTPTEALANLERHGQVLLAAEQFHADEAAARTTRPTVYARRAA